MPPLQAVKIIVYKLNILFMIRKLHWYNIHIMNNISGLLKSIWETMCFQYIGYSMRNDITNVSGTITECISLELHDGRGLLLHSMSYP